nr:hypothetical protein [Candidatus Gracilibacteria bacterium]
METIAIYGGSFNPPTRAHAQVITSVLDMTQIEKIIFTPDGERDDKDHKISLAHRKKMIEIFYEVLKGQGYNIEFDTHFLDGNNGNKTTAMQVRDYFKKKLGFYPWHIFGTDVAPAMPNWSGNYNKIIEEKLKKIFVSRGGYSFNPNLFKNFMLLEIHDIPAISSSMAREMIANRLKVDSILFPEIVDYIEKNNLYTN